MKPEPACWYCASTVGLKRMGRRHYCRACRQKWRDVIAATVRMEREPWKEPPDPFG